MQANTTILKNLIKYGFPLIILITILLANSIIIFYEDSFAREQFEKSETDKKVNNVTFIDFEIRQYLVSSTDEITTTALNEKEIKHLEDVRKIVTILKIALGLMLFISIVLAFELSEYKIRWQIIMKNLVIYASTIVILLVLIRFSFKEIFIGFHKLIFTNDLWMMSHEDTLTKIYPRIFFMTATVTILVRTIIISYALSTIPYIKRIKKNLLSLFQR